MSQSNVAVSISDEVTTGAHASNIAKDKSKQINKNIANKCFFNSKMVYLHLHIRLHGNNGPIRSGRHSGSKIKHTNS